MMYEIKNKASGKTTIVTQKQLDILKAKDWLKRYDPPVVLSSASTDAYVPEEVARMKTKQKPSETKAVATSQAIPDQIPGPNTKG